MKRVGIIGAGESGVSAAVLAKQQGMDVLVSDFGSIKQSYKEELQQHNIHFEESGHDFEWLSKADVIVKSPGVPHKVPIIQQLIANDVKIVSEIEFGFGYNQSKIIGITGSNGKTTTTLLTHHLMSSAGIHCAVGGNLGKSFCRILSERTDYDWIILELSSFQLDDIDLFRPDIAILLNITPDHLDRYDYDLAKYAAAKFNIIRNQSGNDIFIYNGDDVNIKALVAKVRFQNKELPITDSCFDTELLKTFSGFEFDTKTFDLKGRHNMFNTCCAIEAVLAAGVPATKIQSALSSFKNDPHRLEHVATWKGIRFINDSKATNVDAVFYALDAFSEDIIWIAGGTDKGNNYSPLFALAESKVKAIICLGLDNSKIIDSFSPYVNQIVEVQSTDDAVTRSLDFATAHSVVLLSPACASFDLFQNYMDRGDQFKTSVQRLTDY